MTETENGFITCVSASKFDVNSVFVMYFLVSEASNILHCRIYRGIPTFLELPRFASSANPILNKSIILFNLNADTIPQKVDYQPTILFSTRAVVFTLFLLPFSS